MPVNKVRRNGSYAPLSAHYYKDDAVDEAGLDAELLFVRGLAFCADVLSDGFISDRQLVRFVGVGMGDAVTRADKLVLAGLWDREDGGYRVRSWLHWNRSKDEITDYAAKDRDRKRPHPESDRPDPEPPKGLPQESDPIPNGIQTESAPVANGSPNGFHARARTPLHSTPLQEELLVTADASTLSDPFDEFWKLYPNKVKKQDARKSWQTKVVKAKTPPVLVMAALRGQIVRWQSEPEYPRFVPHPTTWLNGCRWHDEPGAPVRAVIASPVLASFEDYRLASAGPEAAELLGIAYVPRPKPPSDPTPRREWQALVAVEWIDTHESALRSALAEKRTG